MKPTTRLRALWSDAGYMTLTEAARILYPWASEYYSQFYTKRLAQRDGVYRSHRDRGKTGHYVPKTWVQVFDQMFRAGGL